MTFTTKIKEEIVATTPDLIDARITLLSYIKFVSTNENDRIHILIENASVARYIFKLIKMTYNVDIKLTIRTQKKFKIKKIFILTISKKINIIKSDIEDLVNNITNSSFEEI